MKRLFLTLAVLLVAVAPADAKKYGDLLLICNKSDDTISFVETKEFKVIATTTTGRGPHEVIVSPNRKWAYVANYEGDGNSLSVIDIERMKELKKIRIDPYRNPHGIVTSKNGKKLYATVEGSMAVIELDPISGQVSQSWETSAFISHMLVLTPNEKKIYVANIGSGSVTSIDKDKNVVKQITTGEGCEGIDVSPNGKEVWASNREADTVSIIDTKSDEVVATLDCEGFPIRVRFTPDGKRVLVSSARAGSVAVFDVKERKLIERIETGSAPIGILIEPDGKRAYVANTRANFVSVVDLEDYKVIAKIEAGRTPDGMGWVKD